MGAPKGPRLPPEIHTDGEGEFIVFPGKACSVCSIALTSRNRYENRLLCVHHGREEDTASRRPIGWAFTAPAIKANPMTTAPDIARKPPKVPGHVIFHSEQYRRLQSLFTSFMNHPTLDDSSALLVSAMNEYELIARLRQVIPA